MLVSQDYREVEVFRRSSDCCYYEDYYWSTRIDLEPYRNPLLQVRFRWLTDGDKSIKSQLTWRGQRHNYLRAIMIISEVGTQNSLISSKPLFSNRKPLLPLPGYFSGWPKKDPSTIKTDTPGLTCTVPLSIYPSHSQTWRKK